MSFMLLNGMRKPFQAALPLLLLLGIFRGAHALVISWNADDLRGVWVLTCNVAGRGTFYVQFSCGGSARVNPLGQSNAMLEILGGGTYQENDTRSVTGGTISVDTTNAAVNIAMTLVNQNANRSTLSGGLGATLQPGKDAITGIEGVDSVNGQYTGSAVKISDAEVANGQSQGQACFLSGSCR